jgi:hypothetical protein
MKMPFYLSSELNESWQKPRLGLHKVQRWFFGLKGVSQQTGDEIDHEVGNAAMAGMGNLRNILEWVVDGFNQRPLAQHEFVEQGDEAILHILAQRRDELEVVGKELFKEWLRKIAFVAEELAPQPLASSGTGWRSSTLPGVRQKASRSP